MLTSVNGQGYIFGVQKVISINNSLLLHTHTLPAGLLRRLAGWAGDVAQSIFPVQA